MGRTQELMSRKMYVISGPCGCGKTTLANALAARIVEIGGREQVYVIHGDDFHRGFVETTRCMDRHCADYQSWPDILSFNWACILSVAEKALERNLDVVIDYVVEDELLLLRELAARMKARLYYVVLTASADTLAERLANRGDSQLTDRSLFLKDKLEKMTLNRKHLYDITGMTLEQELAGIDFRRSEVAE